MKKETERNEFTAGLAGRMRTLALSLDRLDRLESGSGRWLEGFQEDELPQAAVELTLRALRTVSDPTNYQILVALTAQNTLPLTALMSSTSLGRLMLSERLNDLVQVGLASRLIDTDHAQITAAGAAVVQRISALGEQVAASFAGAMHQLKT